MNEGLSITVGLRELSTRLPDTAAILKRAVAAVESGSEWEALRIAMDVDELLHDAPAYTSPSSPNENEPGTSVKGRGRGPRAMLNR